MLLLLASKKLFCISSMTLDQCCTMVSVCVNESYPTIATEPINRFPVHNREIANERLVVQHASLPCLCELSVCQTNVGMNACFRNRLQLWAPQTTQKRTSMPTCAHVAPSKMNVQSQRRCHPLDLVSATRKTLGLHHRDEFERLPSKVLYETWDICSVDIDGVRTIQLWLPGPASTD